MNTRYEPTILCELAYKYGTDKCPQVGGAYYTPFYWELLKDKRNIFKKVLELGVGSRTTLQRTPPQYLRGASLRMWRDFFPNAHVYGVDISPTAIFTDDRIRTFLFNTKIEADMKELIGEIGADIDLVIDDGAHRESSQLQAVNALMPMLNDGVLYIMEDVTNPQSVKKRLVDYNCEVGYTGPERVSNVLIVRKKQRDHA